MKYSIYSVNSKPQTCILKSFRISNKGTAKVPIFHANFENNKTNKIDYPLPDLIFNKKNVKYVNIIVWVRYDINEWKWE